jgi:hypothetical protein
MILNLLMLLLAGASGWLWWKLSLAQQANAQLAAEVTKLRARLRTSGK